MPDSFHQITSDSQTSRQFFVAREFYRRRTYVFPIRELVPDWALRHLCISQYLQHIWSYYAILTYHTYGFVMPYLPSIWSYAILIIHMELLCKTYHTYGVIMAYRTCILIYCTIFTIHMELLCHTSVYHTHGVNMLNEINIKLTRINIYELT